MAAALADGAAIDAILVVELDLDESLAWPTLDLGETGGLVLLSGTISGARAGLRGGFVEVRGGTLERQFLARSRGRVSGAGRLILTGPDLPINGAAVELAEHGSIRFTGADEARVRERLLSRVGSVPAGSLQLAVGSDGVVLSRK